MYYPATLTPNDTGFTVSFRDIPEAIYKDDFGQCAVFLRIEDYCAIRDINGVWREASLSECDKMKNGTLEGMYHIISASKQ